MSEAYSLFYMFDEEMRHPATLLGGTLLFYAAKEVVKIARFHAAERELKQIFVHKVLFPFGHTTPIVFLGYSVRRVHHSSLAGSAIDKNYPKLLKVQQRHVAGFIEHKMLLAPETKEPPF